MKSSEKQKQWKRWDYQKKKEYFRERQRRRKQQFRQIIKEAKDVPCKDCGVKYPYYVMDFDHLRDKKYWIGGLTRISSVRVLLEEIAKCEVVCANCHRERSFKRQFQSGDVV